jgi:hypothetical protein
MRGALEPAVRLLDESMVITQSVLPIIELKAEITSRLAESIRPLLDDAARWAESLTGPAGSLAGLSFPAVDLSAEAVEAMRRLSEVWCLGPDVEGRLGEATARGTLEHEEQATLATGDGLNKNLAAIQLLEAWLSEDSGQEQQEQDDWRRLQMALDEDRLSDRKLFE